MHISLFQQLFSFTGAMLILIAYAGHQFKWMSARSAPYNILNAVGSGILGYAALRPFQLGFVILESAWVGVSLYGLIRGLRREYRVPSMTLNAECECD